LPFFRKSVRTFSGLRCLEYPCPQDKHGMVPDDTKIMGG